MSEGYTNFIPYERLGAMRAQELGGLVVILETACDRNGRVFAEVELREGLYGGVGVRIDALTPQEANYKTKLLGQILQDFKP